MAPRSAEQGEAVRGGLAEQPPVLRVQRPSPTALERALLVAPGRRQRLPSSPASVARVSASPAGQRSGVPVIMLTARDSEIDTVVGLELGADDYVTKPYSSRELLARMKAVLRRRAEPEEAAPTTLEVGPVRLDVERHTVTVRGEPVTLPLKEFDLLDLLLRNAGRVLTRGQLIDRVWGADYVGDTKTLDVHVKRLRTKVESDPGAPRHLLTLRGLGYKFEP